MGKLLIVSYELPLILDRKDHQQFVVTPKTDALSVGLEAFYDKEKAIWIGRPGADKADVQKDERERLEKEFAKKKCHPIYTGKKEYGLSSTISPRMPFTVKSTGKVMLR